MHTVTYAGRLPPKEHSTLQKASSPLQTAPKSIGAAQVAQYEAAGDCRWTS